jgi:hypothetical protein
MAAAVHDLVAAVPAHIDEPGEPGLVADDDDGDATSVASDIIAGIPQFAERPDINPGLAENVSDLLLGDRRIGVPVRRKRLATIECSEQGSEIVDDLAHPSLLL